MIPALIFKLLTVIILKISKTDGACTLPTLLDGTWWDSRTGDITFSQSAKTLTGWGYTAYTSYVVSGFTCIDSDNSFWLFRADTSHVSFGLDYYGLYCIRYEKITDNSYSYYLNSNVEGDFVSSDVDSIRISVAPKSAVDSNSVSISDACSPSTTIPSAEEFHVLVKANEQANVKQWFPDALLGVYEYNVTDKSSVSSCGTGSVWDACTNRTTMKFNYTQCNTQMFGSTGGELYATKYVTSGSTSYVIVINGDASTSTRFTCLAVSGSSVTSNPGSCKPGQTTTSPTDDTNSVIISISPYETCPFTTSSGSSSSSSIVIIVVIIIMILLIVGAIGGFILYFKIKKKRFPWQKSKVESTLGESVEAGKQPPDTMVVEPVSPRVAVDVTITEDKKKTLPPLPKTNPTIDVNRNKPLPSITRQ